MDVARIDAALAQYPLGTLAITDRPYFDVMTDYARAGSVIKATATLATYRAEVTDTAMLRLESTDLRRALGEIVLAAHDASMAIAEFRGADLEYDGKSPNECAPCAVFDLARAYDAAIMTDSTIDAYERFINTPYFNRLSDVDGFGLAGAHKRLGELYAVKGDTARAIAHFQRFLELWNHADPELQPIVTEARRRLALLVAREPRYPLGAHQHERRLP